MEQSLILLPFALLLAAAALDSASSAVLGTMALLAALGTAHLLGRPERNLAYNPADTDDRLVVPAWASDSLRALYHAHLPGEYAACVELTRLRPRTYEVGAITLPPQEQLQLQGPSRTVQHALRIAADACPPAATAHSHPPTADDDHCYASRQDLATFIRRGDRFLLIVCERALLWWSRAQAQDGELLYPVPGQSKGWG